jgi:hypothetical protein
MSENLFIIWKIPFHRYTLTIFKNGRCDGEIEESSLYLLNCEITVLESVKIFIRQLGGATRMAVKIAASSAVEDDGKDAVNADE